MSDLDLAAIREALANRLRTIPDPTAEPGSSSTLFVYDQWTGTPQVLPCAVIFPPDKVDYSRTARRGLDGATWSVLALVGRMSPVAQLALERLMSGVGEWSVAQAIYADRRLGGTVSNTCLPESTTGIYAVSRSANDDLIGVEFTIEVTG